MCTKDYNARQALREAFEMGMRYERGRASGDADGSVDDPNSNVFSIQSARERRLIAAVDAKAELFEAPGV